MLDIRAQNKVTKKVKVRKVRNKKKKQMAKSRKIRPSPW